MIQKKTIAVVVPCYNEEDQIVQVVNTMPDFVDRIVIVNDCSSDNTFKVIQDLMDQETNFRHCIPDQTKNDSEVSCSLYSYADQVIEKLRLKEDMEFTPFEIHQREDCRIICIDHKENSGVGAAIAGGYKWCRDNNIDCTAVMAGDGQMDPAELKSICMPVIEGEVDYVKGNRLRHRAAWAVIPRVRFWGNSILSILTKVASGYWHVSDTQTGYTAIGLDALEGIPLHRIYKAYGVPNDILVKLNIGFFKIKEIPIKPVYNVGEQSKMKIRKVIPRITLLLIVSFIRRLFVKYFFRSFHPIFICYMMFFFTSILDVLLWYKLFYDLIILHRVNDNYLILAVFITLLTIQFLLFGMWFDIQDNERLYVQ